MALPAGPSEINTSAKCFLSIYRMKPIPSAKKSYFLYHLLAPTVTSITLKPSKSDPAEWVRYVVYSTYTRQKFELNLSEKFCFYV
ncbi:MAG: hypothetical protein ACI8RO_002032 [Flavobacteriales bacterium]|jgi:hypothetical protein